MLNSKRRRSVLSSCSETVYKMPAIVGNIQFLHIFAARKETWVIWYVCISMTFGV